MADCRSARYTLTRRWLEGRALDDRELAAAEQHVASCPACRSYLARFSRAIRSSDPDEISCAEARAQMDAGADAPLGQRHLARCAECSAELAAWQSVMALTEQGALAAPPRYPVFDVSFLPQAPALELWQDLRANVRRLAYEIPAALALAGRAVFSPPAGLHVSYASAPAARRARRQQAEQNLVSLTVEDVPLDIGITLDVSEAEKALWLAVRLRLLSTGKPLDQARVALCNERGQAQEIKTVRPGDNEARFPDLSHGQYLLRVEHAGKKWELPLAL